MMVKTKCRKNQINPIVIEIDRVTTVITIGVIVLVEIIVDAGNNQNRRRNDNSRRNSNHRNRNNGKHRSTSAKNKTDNTTPNTARTSDRDTRANP